MSDQGKAWPPNTPGAREAEDDIQQQIPTSENNTQGLGEQMHISSEAIQRCPQRHPSPTSKYQLFENTGDNKTHMVFDGEPAVKPPQRMSRLRLAQMETPDMTKTPWEGRQSWIWIY